MKSTEAIKELELIKSAIEWEHPLEWQIALDAAISALEEQEQCRWRPVMDGDGEMPEVDEDGYSDFIIVNFSNAPGMSDIAQYRVDEAGGAFYSGDADDPYTRYGFFVSAWRPMPKAYRKEENE